MHRIALSRLIRLSAALFASLTIVLPMMATAAAPTQNVLTTPDTAFVTRGDFLRAAMKALQVNLMEDQKKLPYTRVPGSLMPYVQTAHEMGFLKAFGTDLAAGRPITRGEAIQIVVAIERLPSAKVPAVQYRDVRWSSLQGKAIAAALLKGWVAADTKLSFGANRPLTGLDGRILLKNILSYEGYPQSGTGSDSVRIRSATPDPTANLPKEEIMRAVWDLLHKQYLYKDKVKDDAAGYKSIEGLVQSLNDPYTTFMQPASTQNFNSQINGQVTGIGAQVEFKDNILTIVAPLAGSPAEKANLQTGDQILSADGLSLTGMTFDDAVNKVRGPEGSTVTLHIRRGTNEFDVQVQRQQIKTLEIQVSYQGSVAIVKLLQFGSTTDTAFRTMMADVAANRPSGIVLDLRNNPGGLLHAADEVVSAFLPQGAPYISVIEDSKTNVEVTEDPMIIDANVPLVVIVNKGSASASEVVAGALQDAGRATVVGEQSYGKGTVQQIWSFTDGSSFKMTVAEWRTPKGRKIDGVGLTPDIVVAKGDRDAQLIRALEILH